VHFYALQEGDEDLFHDIYLTHERAFDPEEFFELVQEIRRRIQDSFEDDTLVEAIAGELEREHGFVALTDDRIDAAVQVSMEEDENHLIELDDVTDDVDYRGVLADFDPGASRLD
jgi:hypothetical protein